MTVPVQTPINSYIYAGSASFPYSFMLVQAADLLVTVDGATKTLGVDYTVAGVGVQAGGTVTYLGALTVGQLVSLSRQTTLSRPTDYQTLGDFLAGTVNNDFDRLWMALQERVVNDARTLRVPAGETLATLPSAAQRALGTLYFDALGQPQTALLSGLTAVIGSQSATVVVGNGVTDNTAAVVAANALGKPIAFQGVSVIGSATTITVPIVDTMSQIFSATSQVTIANGQPVRPEWWGTGVGAMAKAIAALSSTGGVVQLSNRDYNIVGQYALPTAPGNGVGNQVKNVTLRGVGMPIKAADGTRFVSGSGSVIQGTLVNYADNFRAESLGIDCGSYVVTTLNAGGYLDGFVPGTHQLQGVATDLTTYIKGVSFDRIRVLMATPTNGTATTYKHGFLMEHLIGPRGGSVEVDGGYHGWAAKSVNAKLDSVWVYNQQVGDAYIMKSDAYTLCSGLQVGILTIGREDATLVPPPGYLESTAGGYNTQNIEIGLLRGIKCSALMAPTGAAAPKTNISIGVVMGDQIAGDAIYFDANCSRFTIGTHTLSNITGGGAGIRTATSCAQVNIGNGSVTNAGGDGYALGGDVQHGKINAVNSGGWGVNRSTETVVDPNQISGSGNATGLISSAYVALNSSAFVNSWVDAGGSPAIFQAILVGRSVTLRGTIKNGTAGLVGTLPAGIRPSATQSFITVAVTSGGTRTFGHVDVASDGTITVANFATLAVNCTVAFNFSFSL